MSNFSVEEYNIVTDFNIVTIFVVYNKIKYLFNIE